MVGVGDKPNPFDARVHGEQDQEVADGHLLADEGEPLSPLRLRRSRHHEVEQHDVEVGAVVGLFPELLFTGVPGSLLGVRAFARVLTQARRLLEPAKLVVIDAGHEQLLRFIVRRNDGHGMTGEQASSGIAMTLFIIDNEDLECIGIHSVL